MNSNGCASTAVHSLLGIDFFVTRRLVGLEQYTPVAALPPRRFADLAIEGELAVELSKEPCE
jgi:hypothetical protein